MVTSIQNSVIYLTDSHGQTIGDADMFQGLWTVEQYLRLTERSNRLFEYNNGTIEVLPRPSDRHQIIMLLFYRLLFAWLKPGSVILVAPMLVRINEKQFREPDILLLLDENDPRRRDSSWLGADFVLEVVSPDDPKRDTVVKRDEYAEIGIPEYWIVNPLNETVTVLELNGDHYTEHGIFKRGDFADSVLLQGFSVSVDEVFDAK